MSSTCPKCQSTDVHKVHTQAGHHAGHGLLSVLHGRPLLGVVALVASAIAALVAGRVCRGCGHRF